ncbi:MAG TPA: glycosyltransferase family 39 protein, partial [Candidatus Acidoferrum sp.]|nr:glycosyltransferase family 39 protein [Candidatus Acidoferrum sp.]
MTGKHTTVRLFLLLTSVWFIAAAALATRLVFAWDQQRKIPHEVLAAVPFEQEAGNIALALSQGHGFSDLFRKPTGPTAWLAPVYPWVVSLIFRVFGALTIRSFLAAVVVNAAFSAGATFPLFAIGRRVGGVYVAAAACWAWAFLPAGVLMPFEWIWDTSLSVLLLVTLVWMTMWLAGRADFASWTGYGLLWAFALLTNPALAVGLPFLLGWATIRARRCARNSRRYTAAVLALIVLCCVPWSLRNYREFHRLIPLRSSLPFELWIGNNDLFDPQAVHGIQRITRYEETRRYSQLGENAYLDEKKDAALAFIYA